MSFDSLGLKATLLQAVADSGYTTPTAIQMQAIPAVLGGRDIMAAAQTGTGKTAGFTLPMIQLLGEREPVKSNHIRALVLTPTRELAAQVQECVETYGKHDKLRSLVIFGGVNINPQQMALRKGCDILVATPGRLLDLYQQNAVKFSDVEILVLDEADRMLDMGFIRDIRKILGLLPKKRQNLMFSATFSPEIRELAKTICHNPIEIDVAPRNSTVETITQQVYMVSKENKLSLLAKLLIDCKDQVLVFSRTKHGANNLVKKLAAYGVQSAAIHGNKSQAQRTKALGDFKANRIQVLVATDIAARGIDIDQLAMVINFDLPQVSEDYVHRIGRTGRAGASGLAVSLVTDEDAKLLRDIERLIKLKVERATFDVAALPQAKAMPPETAAPQQSQGRGRQGQRRSGQGEGRRSEGRSGEGRSSEGRSSQSAPRRSEGRSTSGEARSGQPQARRADGQQPRRSQDGQAPRGPRPESRGDRQPRGPAPAARISDEQPREPRAAARPRDEADDNRGNRMDSDNSNRSAQSIVGTPPRRPRSGQGQGGQPRRGGEGRGQSPSQSHGPRTPRDGNREPRSSSQASTKSGGGLWNSLKDLIRG
jgi:ATP-dependent RNA helicase RhlE